MGGAGILGRIIGGLTSDRIGRKITASTCAFIQVLMMIGLIYTQELWMFYLFALLFGFAWGGLAPTIFAMIGDSFGLRNLGSIVGTLASGFNLGAAIGPIIGGFVFDLYHDYSLAFLGGGIAMLIATILLMLIRREPDLNTQI
ncbi:unnamed protein product [marine sediment metagenome]|uniref:Major facilitator superfamily (MFS) profile domain-containing protein n=1 Tax=marine sediment metagenome TaxID=412755 RepID=X1Q6W1_9ZZZZ